MHETPIKGQEPQSEPTWSELHPSEPTWSDVHGSDEMTWEQVYAARSRQEAN